MANDTENNSVNISGGTLHVAADFVAGDKKISYGFSAAEMERLIEKVLLFLREGAAFLPTGRQGELLRAEWQGETLTFRAGAAQVLATRREERAYLLALTVRQEYQVWATKFIPLAAQMDVRRALEIPMAYTEFRVPREGAGLEERVTTIPLKDITQALQEHAAFIILGEPGAGKTTTLQKIAFEAARARLEGKGERIPFFVRLSEQKERAPFDFVRAKWAQHIGTELEMELGAGRVLLLADGVNEFPRDERDARLKEWRLFVEDYAGANQIVFTSRERDYDRQLDLPRVRVEPLDEERIADYLTRNHAEGLREELEQPRARLLELARNPFYLALLTRAYHDDRQGLANRGRLIEWFVDTLYQREEKLAHPYWLHRRAQTRALAQLAYTMQTQGEATTLWYKTAPAALPQMVEHDGEETVIKPADLYRCARAATIFDPASDDVRFYHQLLQEYFAALELIRHFESGEDLLQLWRAPRTLQEMPASQVGEWDPLPPPPTTGWEETTILASGLLREPARLIEAVRAVNPVLAGRMLDEAGIEKPREVTARVRETLLQAFNNATIHLRARLQAGFTLGKIDDPRFVPQTINGVEIILPEMVPVSGGIYLIGSREDDVVALNDESPQHNVELAPFSIARYPVTNAEFACFMQAGGYQDERYWTTDMAKRWLRGEDVSGGQIASWLDLWRALKANPDWKEQLASRGTFSPSQIESYEYIASLSEEEFTNVLKQQLQEKSRSEPHYWRNGDYNNSLQPVVGVTWFEARAYCEWLSQLTARVYRLPTEAEWEAAARGRPSMDAKQEKHARIYPWGDDWDAARANTLEGRVLKPSPVGVYVAANGVSECGAADQCGNVWEWTSTLYQPYPYANDARENLEAEGERVVRGGSYVDVSSDARCAYRSRNSPVLMSYESGFRVFSPGLYS